MSIEDAWAREEDVRRLIDLAGQLGLDGSELETDVERVVPPPPTRSERKKKAAGMLGARAQLVILDELAGWNES